MVQDPSAFLVTASVPGLVVDVVVEVDVVVVEVPEVLGVVVSVGVATAVVAGVGAEGTAVDAKADPLVLPPGVVWFAAEQPEAANRQASPRPAKRRDAGVDMRPLCQAVPAGRNPAAEGAAAVR